MRDCKHILHGNMEQLFCNKYTHMQSIRWQFHRSPAEYVKCFVVLTTM